MNLLLKTDGTAHFVNYAGKAGNGNRILEGNYLRFKPGGENMQEEQKKGQRRKGGGSRKRSLSPALGDALYYWTLP